MGDDDYLAWLDNALSSGLRQFEPELICYIAGADPYREDQLGGLALTIEGLKRRDELVFRVAKARNIPVMVTYAGGYARNSGRHGHDPLQHRDRGEGSVWQDNQLKQSCHLERSERIRLRVRHGVERPLPCMKTPASLGGGPSLQTQDSQFIVALGVLRLPCRFANEPSHSLRMTGLYEVRPGAHLALIE